jgi:hypothetical protein
MRPPGTREGRVALLVGLLALTPAPAGAATISACCIASHPMSDVQVVN